jgi:hypothetical protein
LIDVFSSIRRWADDRRVILLSIFIIGVATRLYPFIAFGIPTDIPFISGGLYYQFARAILDNNFLYPWTVAHYTLQPLPIEPTPLTFYLVAALTKVTGVSLLVWINIMPAILSILTLFAFYYLAKEVFYYNYDMAIFCTFVFAIMGIAFLDFVNSYSLTKSGGYLFMVVAMTFMLRKKALLTCLSYGLIVLTEPRAILVFPVVLVLFLLIERYWGASH